MWYVVDVRATPAAREAVEYALMEAGALGTEAAEDNGEFVRASAYFDAPPERELIRAALRDALHLYDLPSSSVPDIQLRELADQDWLGEWKKNWQPVEVGERFVIAPPWVEIDEAADRIVIRIEPGMAFGTGTHETTRLCLSAIEKYFDGGSFLDVGTGTGILAIAAAKLHPPARIEACDTDADAISIARENARLNGVAEHVSFRVGTVDDSTPSANLVCANLTADVIIPLLPTLLAVSCGRLILSGILDAQAELVRQHLHEQGITQLREAVMDGEWVAIIV